MESPVEYVLVSKSVSETAIVEIYRPVLDPEEYKRRHNQLYKAAEAILKEKYMPSKEKYI